MIRGAIFDLDGTLLDSMHVWDNVGEAYLLSKGVVPPADLAETVKAMSLLQTARYVRNVLGVSGSDEEIMDEINRLIDRRYIEEVLLKPHVKEFLQQLAAAGVKMCVATASDRYMVEAALDRLGVLSCFAFIATCTEIGSGKDEPEIYERALSMLGTPKSETVVFEDALHAVRSAAGAGFRVVAVRDPSTDCDADKIEALAETYLESFAECEVNKL